MAIRKLHFHNSKAPQSQKEAQEKYFVRLIQTHPKYRMVLACLKEGIKPTEISMHFANSGWLTVAEKTFTAAINCFRAKHSDLIEGVEPDGLDAQVDPNQPAASIVTTLHQLLRFQKLRLGSSYVIEKTVGNGMAVKEVTDNVRATREIVETLAKIGGLIDDRGKAKVSEEAGVLENLSNIKKDEVTRNRLHSSIKQLVEVKT